MSKLSNSLSAPSPWCRGKVGMGVIHRDLPQPRSLYTHPIAPLPTEFAPKGSPRVIVFMLKQLLKQVSASAKLSTSAIIIFY